MNQNSIQRDFFESIADTQGVRAIFEHMPSVFFFMKDAQGRHIAANSATFERFGISCEEELIGQFDEKFFPPEIALAYREDDQKVIKSGKPLINRLEPWWDNQHKLAWFICTKLPIYNKKGNIIGVMGITHPAEDRLSHHNIREVTVAVNYAKSNVDRIITTQELAQAAGVSERNLHRMMRSALGLSPYEFLLRTRIQSAAEKLARSDKTIAEIALEHGFCDQSAFTQQFKKCIGMTPKKFQKRHNF